MTARERKVLMDNLVADGMGAEMKKDDLHIGCFERIGSLMQFTKSYEDSKIRLQGVVSKIDITLTHIRAEEEAELIAPIEIAVPEEVINGNVEGDGTHDSSEVIAEGDIVVDEEDVELTTTEVSEDIGVIDSDYEFDLNEQI